MWWKQKQGSASTVRTSPPPLRSKIRNLVAELRLPAVVLDEGPAAERELERVDHQREGGEDHVALGQREAVHVGGLGDPVRPDPPLVGAVALGVEAVLRPRAEMGDVGEQLTAVAVGMGVGGRVEAGDLVGDPERVERLRVEGDRERGLGHRDVLLPELRQVDVAVVREIRGEQRRRPPEDRAAGIGGELAVGDLPFLGRAEGLGAQEAVRVGDLAAGEAEPVEHRQAVEPVPQTPLSDLVLGGPVSDQAARQPLGDRSLDGKRVELDLGLQGLEAQCVLLAGYGLRLSRHFFLLD